MVSLRVSYLIQAWRSQVVFNSPITDVRINYLSKTLLALLDNELWFVLLFFTIYCTITQVHCSQQNNTTLSDMTSQFMTKRIADGLNSKLSRNLSQSDQILIILIIMWHIELINYRILKHVPTIDYIRWKWYLQQVDLKTELLFKDLFIKFVFS